ncbi:DUF2894 domain-containing protein [Alcaligenaceae bacterium]|nr:DUF2894 domain-containing protein [Alcaligenaceae bacterium]
MAIPKNKEATDHKGKQDDSSIRSVFSTPTDGASPDDLKYTRTSPTVPPPAQPGPVAELLAYLNNQSVAGKAQAWQQGDASSTLSYPELPAIDYFQKTWERLRTRRQLQTSQEQVPDNAGPLNSSNLVHRSLSLMREVSPGYLQHFLTYVDTLSWLEETDASDEPAGKGGKAKAAKAKKASASR